MQMLYKGKPQYMNEKLVDLALIEYQRESNRKASLDSKAIGYITFASLLVTSSIGLFAISILMPCSSIILFINCSLLFCEVYFSAWAIVFAFKSNKMRESTSFHINGIIKLWNKEEDVIDGSILKTTRKILDENIKVNKQIEEDNELVYTFIRISIVFFIILFMFSIILICGGKYVG